MHISKLALPTGFTRSAYMERAEMIQNAVVDLLELRSASTAEMAVILGIKRSQLSFHLQVLRAAGEIETVPRLNGRSGRSWRISADCVSTNVGGIRRKFGTAVQLGMVRDPLVAALFGPKGHP